MRIVVTVTQAGSYRVNDRELINASPDTLRAAIVEVAGADRDKPRHRARRRARHAPVGGHRHGRARQAGLRPHQHRDGRRLAAEEMNIPAGAGADRRRSRLPAPARLRAAAPRHVPHRRRRHGAVRRDRAGFAWLVQNFVDLGFVKKDPSVLWLVPLGAPLLFLLRGVGDYIGVVFSGLCFAADHQGAASRPVPPVPEFSGEVLRPAVDRHDAVAAHVQHRTGRRGHDQFHRRADPRFADDHPADRLAVHAQLEAGAVRGDPARRRCRSSSARSRNRSAATARASRLRWATSRA